MWRKTNEIIVIPQIIDILDVKCSIITIDIMGMQSSITLMVIEYGGDWTRNFIRIPLPIVLDIAQLILLQSKRKYPISSETKRTRGLTDTPKYVLLLIQPSKMDRIFTQHW